MKYQYATTFASAFDSAIGGCYIDPPGEDWEYVAFAVSAEGIDRELRMAILWRRAVIGTTIGDEES